VTDRPDLSALRRDAAADIPAPRRSWGTRVALPGALLLAFGALALWAGRDALTPKLDVRTVPVVVKAGLGGGGAAAARAAGWVEPDPFPIAVPALTDGVVHAVHVLEGDRVTAGQIVAKLVGDDAEIAHRAAEAVLSAAKARTEKARAELESAERSLASPLALTGDAEGAAGALREAVADRDAATAEAAAADAAARAAESRGARTAAAAANGLASTAEATEAARAAESARASARAAALRADAAAARVAVAEAANRRASGTRDLAVELNRAARVARASLAEAESDEARATADRDAAALRVLRTSVRSPADGIVLERSVAPGSVVGKDAAHGAAIVSLYDPAKLQVRVDVPLADASKVGAGQKARVTVEALPGKSFEGVVSRVVPQADVQKNTVQVKVRLLAPDPALRPEMLARVEFEAVSAQGAPATQVRSVFAPQRLLVAMSGDGRAVTWVVEDGRAVRRDVRLGGARDGEWVEVTEGLRPGDDLIDADPAELREGRAVRVTGGVQ
jgi:RND family efflux transporter MFP subunit